MIEFALQRLNFILEKVPGLLTQMSEEKMSEKSAPNKWSKKEVVGHLIDSATNNHQRIVRGQFEPIPESAITKTNGISLIFINKLTAVKLFCFGRFIINNYQR